MKRKGREMQEDREIIYVTPDEDGKIIIELYGQKYEIHPNMFDENDVAIIKQFGKIYELRGPNYREPNKKRTRKSPRTMKEAIEDEETPESVSE